MEPKVVLPKLISNESSLLELNAIICLKCNFNFIFIYIYNLDLFKKDNTPILNYNSILKRGDCLIMVSTMIQQNEPLI
jgi:hypothetical protein